MTRQEPEWEEFLAEHKRWLAGFRWAWPILLVLSAAAVIWRFGS